MCKASWPVSGEARSRGCGTLLTFGEAVGKQREERGHGTLNRELAAVREVSEIASAIFDERLLS